MKKNFIFISDDTYYQWTTTSIWESKRTKHATTLFEALATVKKERKYIFPYVLSSASTEQLFKVDIIYKGRQG